MKEKKKYAKAYKNLLKSYFVILIFALVLFFVLIKLFDGVLSGDNEPIINNVVAVVIGIFTSLLFTVICNVVRDSKNYISDIDKDNRILKNTLNDLKLISNMIDFNVNSKKNELEILILYREIQLSRKSLVNNHLFDNISLIGINSLFDDLASSLLKISSKKEFIEESENLLSIIDNITKMVEELIISNNSEKDAFLKEEEYLNNLFEEKNKG